VKAYVAEPIAVIFLLKSEEFSASNVAVPDILVGYLLNTQGRMARVVAEELKCFSGLLLVRGVEILESLTK